MKKRVSILRLVLLLSILILALVVIYSGLRILESTVLFPKVSEPMVASKTIVRDGVEYYPRQDITVVMVAGIDQTGPMVSSGTYNNPGAADMISLLIFDHTNEKVDILSINRDTMMDVPVLGYKGKDAGTLYGQLALAHTYGDGLRDSSLNLRKAVSNLLYGLDIDYYVTMNMDAIAKLNDGIGGVTVNVTEDFSQVDPSIPMGEVKLMGQQAVNFVRSRRGVGNGLNLTRMERHKEYMSGFMAAIQTQTSQVDLLNAYDDAADYMVTDCSTKVIASMMDRYGDYQLGKTLSLPGENVKGEEYMEYHVDEEKLDKLIVENLYAPK